MYREKRERNNKEQFELLNLGAWLNGIYMTHAIGACFSKDEKYPSKPIDFNNQKDEERSCRDNAENFREYVLAFNENFRKRKSGELDGN